MAPKVTGKGKNKKQKVIKDPLPMILCKGECGIRFYPKDRRQHFHSDNCREAYYAKHYFAKQTVSLTCPNCQTVFPTTKPGRQVYCCPECRIEHAQKVRNGVIASVTAEHATYLGDRYATMEASKFKCSICGKGVADGVSLDVEPDGNGALRTVCNMCVKGREFNQGASA